MKTFRGLFLAVLCLGALVTTFAQEVGGSLLYDFKTRSWAPVVSVKALSLDDFAVKGLKPELRFLAGIQEARGLVATAIVVSYPVAKQFSLEAGGAVRFLSDRTPSFGIVIGASIKF